MSGAGTSDQPKKNLGGRPTERGESKRAPISMRTTPAIRAALEAAAEKGGRSLAQEIEQRLERSVAQEEAYSPDTFDALDAIRQMMEATHVRVGASWSDDLTAWEIVTNGIVDLMIAYRPERRGLGAPAAISFDSDQNEAIAEYEAALAAWEAKRKAIGHKAISVAMKARAGEAVSEDDRIAARLERVERESLGPKPRPPLEGEHLASYEAGRQYDAQVEGARRFVGALSYPVRRRRGLT